MNKSMHHVGEYLRQHGQRGDNQQSGNGNGS